MDKEEAIERTEMYNTVEGNLNLEDGIECPICLNRGYMNEYYQDEITKKWFIRAVDCECKKKRLTIQRLNRCGITKATFERLTFKNYIAKEEWQKNILNFFREYLKEYKAGKRNWLMYSGITGSGKTHLCTALFKYLIDDGNSGIYFKWVEEIQKLIKLKKSFNEDDDKEYNKNIKQLKNTDVLYIDDLFKMSNTENKDILIEIMNIIELRKDDANKITIFSSELGQADIDDIDMALMGRIYERAGNGKFVINCFADDEKENEERNYRYGNK